jgi:hypothetical protein
VRILQQNSDIASVRSLLLVHFSICSIGLLGVISLIAGWAGQTFIWPLNLFISYNDWALLSTAPTKPIELLQYALSVAGMVLYYAIVLIFIKNYSGLTDEALKKVAPNRVVFIGYLVCLLLLNIWLLKDHGEFSNIYIGFWFLILVLPVLPLANSWLEWMAKGSNYWYFAIFAVLIASLAFSFYPYIIGELEIGNDYMDIPEQTILSSGLVDNTDYINTHRIGGLYKNDPRIEQGKQLPRGGEFIKLAKSEAFSKFVENNPQKFKYEEESGLLIVKELMKPDEADNLAKMAANEVERGRIYSFYYNQLVMSRVTRSYSTDEIEFIRKNRLEFLDQALAGHYFHHQNTMLGTINEYSLNKPQIQTVFLYGWLSTIVIAEAMKALGGISFEVYQKVFYSFYPLYYLLLIVAAAIIFKRSGYVLLVGVISVSSLYFIGFETIRFAPGFNPIRHFFDIFALVCFYWYLFAQRRNLLYLMLAFVFSIVGILFSKEFGLVLLLSMLATIIIRMRVNRNKSALEIILIIVATLAALASLLLIRTGVNQTLLYVLLGVATPAMHWIKMYSLLLLFSAIYIFIIKSRKNDDKLGYLSLFWFLYAQGLLIYYIWNPAPNHLLSLGTVWGMLLALLLRQWSGNYDWAAKCEKRMLLASNSLMALFVLLPSIGSYFMEQSDYWKIFAEHKLYRWDFPRAHFISTMDPKVFENAVQLIDKYSVSHSIYMLSKYDNILPFLSAKYNAMPFTEVALSLVTRKEMDKSADLIRHERPEYLFVDTDMARSHAGDVFDKNDPVSEFAAPVYEASRGRAMVLDNFAKVFKEVEGMYEPVEVGNLITVYKRR